MEIPAKPKRQFLPQELKLTGWKDLQPYFEDLKNRAVDTKDDLLNWLADKSEVEAVLEEDQAWRYIHMSIDTANDEKRKRFEFFVQEIEPHMAPYANAFDKKFLESKAINELEEVDFRIAIKKTQKNIAVYEEKNIPIISELQTEAQQFGAINGKMQIEHNGETITMQKAASLLKDTDRLLRKSIYEKIGAQRLAQSDALHDLFSSLVKKRHMLATNAGYSNYRDYMFDAMQRFDYSPQACFDFHDAVEHELVPLLNDLALKRKNNLGVESLKPYDLAVDSLGRAPLKPFKDGKELIEKSVVCFDQLDPYFGGCLAVMDKMGHLDLESKKGKAPGGYNYPLYEIGVPFIFMNAVGTLRDLVTMVHEGGHAVHSFLSRDLPYTVQKNLTSEVAELASMSMELLSMDHWDQFFVNDGELKRAKLEHLEDVLSTLPWIALIDKFQHWVYENPNHSVEERTATWNNYLSRFSNNVVDYKGYEDFKDILWQKQLHLFEVPFYYIEYGMAQLGAIAMYKNYKSDKKMAIQQYKDALSLGYKNSIHDIYQTAGIAFDFSRNYIKELVQFIQNEINSID